MLETIAYFEEVGNQKEPLLFLDDLPMGHQLKVKRIADGLKQEKLAEMLGMSICTLSKAERGGDIPKRCMPMVEDYLYHAWYRDGVLIDRIEYE